MPNNTFKQYAIKIGGSVWTGDYLGQQWEFDTYEEAQSAIFDMELDDHIHGDKPVKRTIVEREVTAWRKVKRQ